MSMVTLLNKIHLDIKHIQSSSCPRSGVGELIHTEFCSNIAGLPLEVPDSSSAARLST